MGSELQSLQATLDSVLSSGDMAVDMQPLHEKKHSVNVTQETESPARPLTQDEQKTVTETVKQINHFLDPLSVGLSVTHIESLNRFYVQVVNKETSEVIREIPPEKIIEMEQNLRTMQGLLFDRFS